MHWPDTCGIPQAICCTQRESVLERETKKDRETDCTVYTLCSRCLVLVYATVKGVYLLHLCSRINRT